MTDKKISYCSLDGGPKSRSTVNKSQGRSRRLRLVWRWWASRVDQHRAHVPSDAPGHAVTPGNCVAGQAQPKFVGNLEPDCVYPYATVRHVGDEAVPRRGLVGNQGRKVLDALAPCTASFVTHRKTL